MAAARGLGWRYGFLLLLRVKKSLFHAFPLLKIEKTDVLNLFIFQDDDDAGPVI